MASTNVENQIANDPEYITYLLDQSQAFDWYFDVGNGLNNTSVEKIGVVKKMLLAHSEVFRRDLQESQLVEENKTHVNDIFPDTFKNLLRYVYGFNNTASLSFDDADQLLYVADKYMIDKLMASLSSRLLELLSYENVCSLMNNPACYRVLELDSAITHGYIFASCHQLSFVQIIQLETKQVLASPLFLDMIPEAFLTILRQNEVEVPEIELWDSAVKWAKNRARSDASGPALREELATVLPHIRLCTVALGDFLRDVMPTRILTDAEMVEINLYHGDNDHQPYLPDICDITQPRTILTKLSPPEDLLTFNIGNKEESYWTSMACFGMSTRQHYVELSSLVFHEHNNSSLQCKVEIDQITCAAEPSVLFSMSNSVEAPAYAFVFPSSSDEIGNVVLLPNSNYRFTMKTDVAFSMFYNNDNTSSISGEHFTVSLSDHNGYYTSGINAISYKLYTS